MTDDDRWIYPSLERAAHAETPPANTQQRLAGVTFLVRKRQRRRYAGVAVAAAVAMGIGPAFLLLPNSAQPADSESSSTFHEPDLLQCADTSDLGQSGRVVDLTSAISIQLCAVTPAGGSSATPTSVPLDALTTGVSNLVSIIESGDIVQPSVDDNRACELDLGATWKLAVTLSNGDVVPVSGTNGGCQDVSIAYDSQLRAGVGEAVYEGFIESLTAQRASTTPPGETTSSPPNCERGANDPPDYPAVMPVRPPLGENLRQASLCWQTDDMNWHQETLTDADIQLFDEDINPNPPASQLDIESNQYCDTWKELAIVGTTTWGDPVRLQANCGVFEWGSDISYTWSISAYTFARLIEITDA